MAVMLWNNRNGLGGFQDIWNEYVEAFHRSGKHLIYVLCQIRM